jgi:cobalt-zinc-cadmium efflux system outer membrane protein
MAKMSCAPRRLTAFTVAAILTLVTAVTLQAQTGQEQNPQSFSAQFFDISGFTVESLVALGFARRADLLAAQQELAIAEGRLLQAGLRPNPTLDAEYGSPRFLAGEAEQDFSIGVSQVFETGGKRRKRTEVARLALAQARAEVRGLERQFAADIRASFARTLTIARQLETLERLITANEELVRVTAARLKEGDVAPFDLSLVRLETDRLRAQVINSRAEIESELIGLRALVSMETTEPLRLAPLAQAPPRLDLSLTELTDLALRERADLQAAKIAEEAGRRALRLPARSPRRTSPPLCVTRAVVKFSICLRRSASTRYVTQTTN